MPKPPYAAEMLADIETGQALALKMHNDVIVPANPSLETRIFAIAVLAAEFAVTHSETLDEANALIDTIADAARSALPSGFEAKPQIGGKPQ